MRPAAAFGTGAVLPTGLKLIGTGASGAASQGSSTSLSGDGDTTVIGALDDHGSVGAAWAYVRGGVWSQQAKLVAAATGTGVCNTPCPPGEQGCSVALSGDGSTPIVGSFHDEIGLAVAFVFTRSSGVWTQQAELAATGQGEFVTSLGWSVALSGDGSTAIVGNPNVRISSSGVFYAAARGCLRDQTGFGASKRS